MALDLFFLFLVMRMGLGNVLLDAGAYRTFLGRRPLYYDERFAGDGGSLVSALIF